MKVNETDDPLLHKIDVDVYLVEGDVITSATGFVAKL
jgi:hypothetical protein